MSQTTSSKREKQQKVEKPVEILEPGLVSGSEDSIDGSGLQIGIVSTREHGEIANAMVAACRDELVLRGVDRDSIHEARVALPFEIPYAIKRLILSAPMKIDVVICLGCVVRGNSLSYEFVGEAVTRAAMKVGMMTSTPVIYGLMTCMSEDQARTCADLSGAGGEKSSHGVEWAQSAIEMAHINDKASDREKRGCACECH